jgi:parallel beta-helix repeat protein
MALTKAHNRMIDGASISVKDFGATGDGITDDTTAIQAALAGGGTVYFPEGTYLTGSLAVYSDTEIIGAKNSIILATLITTSPLIRNAAYPNGNVNISIHDLTIDGGGPTAFNDTTIQLQNCTNTSVKDCHIYNYKNFAISVLGAESSVVVADNYVDGGVGGGPLGTGTAGGGINFSGGQNYMGNKCTGNTVINCAASGIVIQGGAKYIIVTGNTASYNGLTNGNGIYAGHANTCVISNNICRWNSWTPKSGSGIGINTSSYDCTNHTITGNICEYNGDDGIDVNAATNYKTSFHTITGNQLNYNWGAGINIAGYESKYNTISANQIKGNGAAGIHLNADSGRNGFHTISDNIMLDNGQQATGSPGIRCWDDNCTITGNVCSNTTGTMYQGGISVAGISGVVVGNTITNTTSPTFTFSNSNDHCIGFNSGSSMFKVGGDYKLNPAGATPDVTNVRTAKIYQAGAINITDFVGGQTGKEIILQFMDGHSTLIHSAALKLEGSVNVTMTGNNMISLIHDGIGWVESSRSIR